MITCMYMYIVFKEQPLPSPFNDMLVAKPNSLVEGLNNQPQQTITPGELQQKKKGYWARWGSDLKRCTIECLMLTAQIGMTVADFVKFGKENQLYNERQEAEKAEWERRRKMVSGILYVRPAVSFNPAVAINPIMGKCSYIIKLRSPQLPL